MNTYYGRNGYSLRLEGLEDERHYTVAVRRDLGEPETIHVAPPPWLDTPVTLPGRVLRTTGLAAPQLLPQSALLLEVRAT